MTDLPASTSIFALRSPVATASYSHADWQPMKAGPLSLSPVVRHDRPVIVAVRRDVAGNVTVECKEAAND